MITSSGRLNTEQMTRLVDDTIFVSFINEVGKQRSWWLTGLRWTRQLGRLNFGKEPFATLVFQTEGIPQEICHIEVGATSGRDMDASEGTAHYHMEGLGWVRFRRFPDDPGLPAIKTVLRQGKNPRVMQYLPQHRCIIHFSEGEDGKPTFAKVFDSDIGKRIHEESASLWEVSKRGELGFSIPEPYRWDEDTRTLWQGVVEGIPINMSTLLQAEGYKLSYKMGRAIATLHRSRMRPHQMFDANVVLQQAGRHSEELRERLPHLTADTMELTEDIARAHQATEEREQRPIHTDLHPQQWIEHETGLGLVDFDRIAWGDPECDAATFLTELEFKNKGRGQIPHVTKAFMNGYQSTGLQLNHRLINIYRAHKWLAKALRASRKIQLDGPSRARKLLCYAHECLSDTAGQNGEYVSDMDSWHQGKF